jgi:hypothetical protein
MPICDSSTTVQASRTNSFVTIDPSRSRPLHAGRFLDRRRERHRPVGRYLADHLVIAFLDDKYPGY